MTIHDEIRLSRNSLSMPVAGSRHQDGAADAAELAIYETARALGYLTTQAARIAGIYGRSLNL